MTNSLSTEFGPLRSFLWPIHRNECRKVIPMTLIVFLACLCYSILRNMKDSLVVTASGAEVIPFIKVWVLLPCAILSTIAFSKLANHFQKAQIFYIVISFFLSAFVLFGFILYPLKDYLHPTKTADMLELILPVGCKGLVDMFRHWTFTGFYVLTELWATIVMHVLFWGFANEITRVSEAKRFYPVFAVFSNISAIIAGQVANLFSQQGDYNPNIPFGSNAWEQTIMIIVMIVCLSGFSIIAIMRWLDKHVLSLEMQPTPEEIKTPKPKKKLSIRESFSYLSNSNYLTCIAVLVLSYNLVINLVEVIWKSQLKQLYPDPTYYFSYLNNLTTCVGVISTGLAFVLPRIINNIGWTGTALITPTIMLITSCGFFLFMIFQDYYGEAIFALTGITPLAISVFFGTTQNCLSKACKYSVFDATKEMSFIPLSPESKLKGKAAIDGVGSRLGKSGGSILQQGLLIVFKSLHASAPYIGAALVAVIAGWIVAVKSLGRMFGEMAVTEKSEKAAS